MPEPLKNLYDRRFVETVAEAVKAARSSFDDGAFIERVLDEAWPQRELKARMRHITHSLRAGLGGDYPAALVTLREAAASPYLADASDYALVIFPDYVEVYGLDFWDESLAALEYFTQQSTAEFAVRPFIERDPERMMAHMLAWTQHENHHVRRLASEGCRPRLPWAGALTLFKDDPTPIVPILDTLHADESLYVRRSVANNLNDISKDHPDVTRQTLRRWQQSPSDHLAWVTKHALRTLIKAGDTEALALIGYGDASVHIDGLRVDPDPVALGDAIEFSFAVISAASDKQALLIDYVMTFVRKNDAQTHKVFKLTQTEIGAGEHLRFSKTFSFRPLSTRRYYAGTHRIAVQINGRIMADCTFTVTD